MSRTNPGNRNVSSDNHSRQIVRIANNIQAAFLMALIILSCQSEMTFGQENPANVRKVVLAELFTGSECPPCAAADRAFDRLLEKYSKDEVAVLEYHLNIPRPDPMATDECHQRAYFYMGGSQSTPQSYFDGIPGILGGGPRTLTGRYYSRVQSIMEEATAEKAPLAIEAKVTGTFSVGKVEVTLKPLMLVASNDIRLFLVFYEDEIQYRGRNGVSHHRHVVRNMADGPQGKAISLGTIEQTYLWNINRGIIENEKLGMVIFVQESESRMVLQAAVVEMKDEFPDALKLFNQGAKLAKENKLDEAIELMTKAVEIDPDSAAAYRTLGNVCGKKDNIELAIHYWQTSLNLDANQADLHWYLGLGYESLERTDMAISHLEKFLELVPDHPQAKTAAEKLQRLKDQS